MDKELKGIEAGGIDYLTKPVSVIKLRARLKNHFAMAQPPRRTRG